MGIRRIYGAGAVAKAGLAVGQQQAAKESAQRAQQIAAQKAAQEDAQKYQQAVRQQDLMIDLQMRERAKLWEIEKMELASRMDFQRKETERQRKLTNIDNKLSQLEKEKESGKFSSNDPAYQKAINYWESQKMFVETGIKSPTTTGREFGIQPYWMAGKEAPVGTPERQLYDAKLGQQISGVRTGTIPYYLDPSWLKANRGIAQQVLEAHEVFLNESEIDALINQPNVPTTQPGTKTLDAETARAILMSVGGDKERAREIARQSGYSF